MKTLRNAAFFVSEEVSHIHRTVLIETTEQFAKMKKISNYEIQLISQCLAQDKESDFSKENIIS